ncbi:MAG: hypothetical protein HOE40_00190, partial [Candidatus Pacebacteria bacterium]|nr:hypothetical protein [Candidatus Paceibacterota bacterium]
MLEKATGHIPEEEKTKRIRNPLKPFVDKIYNKVVYGETDRNTLREKSLDKLTKYIETKIVLSAEEITVFNGRYEGPAKEFEFKITSVKPNYGKKVNKESGQFQAGVLFVVELLSTDPPDEIVENNQKIN